MQGAKAIVVAIVHANEEGVAHLTHVSLLRKYAKFKVLRNYTKVVASLLLLFLHPSFRLTTHRYLDPPYCTPPVHPFFQRFAAPLTVFHKPLTTSVDTIAFSDVFGPLRVKFKFA